MINIANCAITKYYKFSFKLHKGLYIFRIYQYYINALSGNTLNF